MNLWMILNTLAIAILGGITFLVLRQLGFVLQRAGPVSARSTSEGPRIGENIASHFAPAGVINGKANIILFMSETCSVCGFVRTGAEELARVWNRDADLFLVYDCGDGEDTRLETNRSGLYVKKDSALRDRLGVNFVPFAAVTTESGTVVGKGLVNDVTHLESLLELEKTRRLSGAEMALDAVTTSNLSKTVSQS